jgi:hypothetical protein
MKKKPLSDPERILLRKRIEEREWTPKWAGRLNSREARLDLWRRWHRRGCIDLDAFKRFKRQAGFYDEKSIDTD